MREQLLKAFQRNQIVAIIYISKSGEITKRRIRISKMSHDTFQAYCFLKHAKRIFLINNVLAVVPEFHREREVI